ncbi:MAG: hypothetical protein M0Q51_09905 [Bacteroidales bacterium]|nr:hypothetical protein [Bacteroidales bacterium]
MLFRRKRKISRLLVDSFRQNYISDDPLMYFHEALHNGQEFVGIKTNSKLKIGQFDPGEKLWAVRRKIKVYDSALTELPNGDSITTLLGIDELEDLLRISVYRFLNKSLFSLTFHFPFISPEEVEYLMGLIKEKYLSGVEMTAPDFTRITGSNDVIILLNHFVSLSYEFIHASTSNIALISKLNEKRRLMESSIEKKRKDMLLGEL